MRRRRAGEDGAIVVEFALIVPILALLISGIVEFGMAYRESLNLSAALRSAARQATTTGAERTADYLALQAFVATLGDAEGLTLNKVVVYRTTALDGEPLNPSCFTSDNPNPAYDCNVYTASQLGSLGTNPSVHFGTTDSCVATAWDADWCPLSRSDRQGDPPDFVGVYAEVEYASWTSLLPLSTTITDRAVLQIEPQVT